MQGLERRAGHFFLHPATDMCGPAVQLQLECQAQMLKFRPMDDCEVHSMWA